MPAFNPATANNVVPWRHAPSAQTVSYHQPGEVADTVDLFGISRVFIANVTAEQAEANNVPVPAPTASLPITPAVRLPAFVELIEGDAALNKLNASAADFGKWVEGEVDGETKSYQVRAGTDAQALPGIVRPANFHAITNPFVFVAG